MQKKLRAHWKVFVGCMLTLFGNALVSVEFQGAKKMPRLTVSLDDTRFVHPSLKQCFYDKLVAARCPAESLHFYKVTELGGLNVAKR